MDDEQQMQTSLMLEESVYFVLREYVQKLKVLRTRMLEDAKANPVARKIYERYGVMFSDEELS